MISRKDSVAGFYSTSRLLDLATGLAIVVLGASLLVAPAAAQRRGGFVFAASAHGGAGATHVEAPVLRRGAANRIAGRRVRRSDAGYGYFSNYYPYYDSPLESSEEAGEALSPQAPVRAANGPASAKAVSSAKPVESLVVELRGDRWVRLTGYGASEIDGQLPSSQIVPEARSDAAGKSGSKGTDPSAGGHAAADGKLPPAVLVFRDGHREEIMRYTIVGKNITIKSDYWTSGSWTRNIAIADLNVAATLKANQERGAKFSLPSRPGEVVMRP